MNTSVGLVIVVLLCGPLLLTAAASAATYVVDTNGPKANDRNPGTPEAPFKTISAAARKVRPGDRIVIKGGVYRESFTVKIEGTEEEPVVVEAAEGETVVVTGADLVTGWVRAGLKDRKGNERPVWKKAPWKAWARYGTSIDRRKQGPQLIVDNVLLKHVASQAEMVPGSFCYDPADGGAIYLWMFPPREGEQEVAPEADWWDEPVDLSSADPNDHQVEASVRSSVVSAEGSYITLRGLTVRYNNAYAQHAGLSVRGRFSTVEDCVVEYCHGRGLTSSGDHITVRRCYVRFNGASGAGGQMTDSLWEDNVLDGNTTRGISHGWEAGGVKFVRTVGLTVRRCQFINNDGPGLWFDWGNSGNVIEQCFCSFNSSSGIKMEVSPHFESTSPDARPRFDEKTAKQLGVGEDHPVEPNILRNNVCVGNRWDGTWGSGIELQLASDTIVVNNTVVDNDQYGIFVRYHPYDNSGHRCVDNVILNNVCVGNGGSQIYVTPDPVDKPGYVARNRSDYNLLYARTQFPDRDTFKREPPENPVSWSKWGKTQGDGTYSLEEWFKIRGFDEHSIQADPIFVSPRTLDFRLQHGSPAIGAGTPTDCVTNDYLGRPRPEGRPPSIGALEHYPERPAVPVMPMR